MSPHVKSDISGRLPTSLHIPTRSGHERCVLLNEAMDEEPQISGLMVGGSTTGYAVMGGTRYPVRVLNGIYSPYQPVWFYRVRLYRSVVICGRTKHRRRYKSSMWLSSHKTKRRSTFASRRIGGGIGHRSHGFGHHGIGHIGS